MKLFHLSDLHIGKRVNDFSILEDQKYILKQVIRYADSQNPDGIIIAGDVYDKSIPSTEAVELFDDFLVKLAACHIPVYIIAGNHDSPERLAFASKLIDTTGVHISPVYKGFSRKIAAEDSFGPVNIYLLPFIKPAHVRRFFPEAEIESYTDAVRIAIESMNIDTSERNVLVTHQFVTGASRTESEDISVGGTDNVDAAVFDGFDYVALGHIHRAQPAGDMNIRYSGTPLKYSFSEVKDKKTITVVELREKGELELSFLSLEPLRDMVEIKGSFDLVSSREFYSELGPEDYYRVILTDEVEIPDAISKLRVIYKNIMRLDFDNSRTRSSGPIINDRDPEKTDPLSLFAELFEKQQGKAMSDKQLQAAKSLIEKIWEAEP